MIVMVQCVDCKRESDKGQGWWAEYTAAGKVLRCSECGQKEDTRRWNELYPGRLKPKFEEIMNTGDVGNRIQHAKDLREAGIHPWTWRQEAEGQQGASSESVQPERSKREDHKLIYRDPHTGEVSPVRDLFNSQMDAVL